MIKPPVGSEIPDSQSPAYDLYELNPVWTFKNVVNMMAGPRPAEQGASSDPTRTRARDLVRKALIGAYKTDRLVPINKDEVEEELRVNARGEFVPQFELNIYEIAEYKREDVIVWIIKERNIDTLQQQGNQVPGKTIELIEKIIRLDQIKLPDSEADSPNRSMDSLEGIFPAPEGTRWKDVHFILTKNVRLKIRVKSQETIANHDDLSKFFPQEQLKKVFFKIIHQGGVFDKEILNEISEKAIQNSKQIVSKLRRFLKKRFGITDDPIPWNNKTKMYETLFGTHSELDLSALSDQN